MTIEGSLVTQVTIVIFGRKFSKSVFRPRRG